MSYKSVPQECPTRVSHKSVPQECPIRVSHKSVLQKCPTRVSYKSDPQECPRVSCKSVLQGCPTRVSYKSVIWTYVVFSKLFPFGFVGSILFFYWAEGGRVLYERCVSMCGNITPSSLMGQFNLMGRFGSSLFDRLQNPRQAALSLNRKAQT